MAWAYLPQADRGEKDVWVVAQPVEELGAEGRGAGDGPRFPFNTRAARVDAVVHAPAAFRRRGVYVAAQELEVA